jgi:ribosomal protein S18 acetylase RimI-like enzyme
MRLREFDLERDYDAVLALWRSAGPGLGVGRSDTREELAKKLRRDPDLFLVAESGGDLIGSVIGGFDGRRGVIYHLAVAAGHRRQGLGRALMREVEARLRNRGCRRSYLMVRRGNPDALQFYAALGWAELDLHILAKDLDAAG